MASGTVKWFGNIYGFIEADSSEDVFVHSSDVIDGDEPVALRWGERVRGRVTRLMYKQGYGFAVGDDGRAAFFHQSSLGGTGIRAVAPGARIEYALAQMSKGARAVEMAVLEGAADGRGSDARGSHEDRMRRRLSAGGRGNGRGDGRVNERRIAGSGPLRCTRTWEDGVPGALRVRAYAGNGPRAPQAPQDRFAGGGACNPSSLGEGRRVRRRGGR